MNSFSTVCLLILVLAVFQANASTRLSRKSLRHELSKRSPDGECSYPPCPTPMTPTTTSMPPTPMPPMPPTPMPPMPPTPMPPMPPTPPSPSPDCVCPTDYVLPSVSKLLADLNLPLGNTLLGLLGDNALVTPLNALLASLIMNLTGCPVQTATPAGQGGLLALLPGLFSG